MQPEHELRHSRHQLQLCAAAGHLQACASPAQRTSSTVASQLASGEFARVDRFTLEEILDLVRVRFSPGMLVVLLFAVGGAEARWLTSSAPDPWSMFRGGPQRNGRSPSLFGPSSSQPPVRWMYKLQGPATASPTVDNEGRIFVGDKDNIHAVRSDGTFSSLGAAQELARGLLDPLNS